jgi:hypothetical protein
VRNRSRKSTSMRSRGSEKVTVDRLLRLPPVHIDGKGLRAYRSFELMAAKVSKEPVAEVSNSRCARSQRNFCCDAANLMQHRGCGPGRSYAAQRNPREERSLSGQSCRSLRNLHSCCPCAGARRPGGFQSFAAPASISALGGEKRHSGQLTLG